MKRLEQGSVICIPLLLDLGYAFAKFIDLTKINEVATMPEILKVYDLVTTASDVNLEILSLKYLTAPMLVAGIRPALRSRRWSNVGKLPLEEADYSVPDFKSGNETWDDIAKGEWFIVKGATFLGRQKSSYEQVKYLQPYVGIGTGNFELRLTMYFLMRQGKRIDDFFNLKEETYNWNYRQVIDSPPFDA
jgi:hypothetical protein